ncbi:MAG TPA: class I SAM-dependent methyltransferase [Ignavibacteria bacterium]|nr:class I SAM-dependent methyltransferase [Ignavibacteria bacterium]
MKKTIKKIIFKLFPSIKFKRSGERQVAPDLSGIRADHVGRYKFASQYIKPGMNVLDIACGIGYGSYVLASSSPNSTILGIDIEQRAIDYANKHYKRDNNKFSVGDASNLNLENESFEAVVSFETIEHLKQPKLFIEKVKRVLKEDGLFIVSSPNQTTLPFDKTKYPFHEQHFTSDELSKLLIDSRFEIVDVYSQLGKDSEEVINNDSGLYFIIVAKSK